MLDYPKLEIQPFKKGGRVKIINNSIIKKKKMKQKQTQKQIVNVYTHTPAKRTYRRLAKKVEPQPQPQRQITLAQVRAELPSYIYSRPLTLPTLNQPSVSSVIPPLNQPQQVGQQENLTKDNLKDLIKQIVKMKEFQKKPHDVNPSPLPNINNNDEKNDYLPNINNNDEKNDDSIVEVAKVKAPHKAKTKLTLNELQNLALQHGVPINITVPKKKNSLETIEKNKTRKELIKDLDEINIYTNEGLFQNAGDI